MAFAKHQASLYQKEPDGSTLLDHLKSIEKQTKKTPPLLIGPGLPESAAYLWDWFCEFQFGRLETSLWDDLAKWCELREIRLQSWEITAFVRLDMVAKEAQAEAIKRAADQGGK